MSVRPGLLFTAIKNNKLAEVQRLLSLKDEKGSSVIDVNIIADQGTALMSACDEGRVEIVKVLLAHGANLNLTGPRGKTALMIACEKNRDFVARMLLDRGADVSVQDEDGNTALHFAFRTNDRLAEHFAWYGANFLCRIKSGHTPIHSYRELHDTSTVERIQSLTVFSQVYNTAPAMESLMRHLSVPAVAVADGDPDQPLSQSPRRNPAVEVLTEQLRELTQLVQTYLERDVSALTEQKRLNDELNQERDSLIMEREQLRAQARQASPVIEALTEQLRVQRQMTQLMQTNLEQDAIALTEQLRLNDELKRERDAAFAERDQLRAQVPI